MCNRAIDLTCTHMLRREGKMKRSKGMFLKTRANRGLVIASDSVERKSTSEHSAHTSNIQLLWGRSRWSKRGPRGRRGRMEGVGKRKGLMPGEAVHREGFATRVIEICDNDEGCDWGASRDDDFDDMPGAGGCTRGAWQLIRGRTVGGNLCC